MSLKRLLLFLFMGFFLFFIMQQPKEAANLVKATGESAAQLFESAARSFVQFVKNLV